MFDNWYAVQVRTGNEEKIQSSVSTLISKHILSECFIPKCQKMKKFHGKWVNVNEILFKGYVFMVSDHVDELFNELKKIADLTKILGNDGENIYPIRKEEAIFLTRFGGKEHLVEVSSGYQEGDQIRITNGPLYGQEGSIVKVDRHKRIAYVDVSLFGQVTRIQVGLEIISKS